MVISFREFLVSQKQRSSVWWEIVRTEFREGTLPDLDSWPEVRQFVATRRRPNLKLEEVRATWSAYTHATRKARLGGKHG